MKYTVAVLDKSGQEATDTAAAMLKTFVTRRTRTFAVASPFVVRTGKDVDALGKTRLLSHAVIGQAFTKTMTSDSRQLTLVENGAMAFEGVIYPETKETRCLNAIAASSSDNRREELKKLVNTGNGDFVFALVEDSGLVLGRDCVGVRPFYYGENKELVAFASDRKALWKTGLKETHPFSPGSMAFVDLDGVRVVQPRTIFKSQMRRTALRLAPWELLKLLKRSVRERVASLKEVAVAFSGGLDSSAIAFLAKKLDTDVHLIHVSMKNQPETEYAMKVAQELDLPIHAGLHDNDDVEHLVRRFVWLAETTDPVKVCVGLPLYWAAEKAARMNFRVMLAGHGADELFGGYKKYVDCFLLQGAESLRKRMFDDFAGLAENDLARDFKVCRFHDVELRLPYLARIIVQLAFSLPIKLKIERSNEGLRKLVLRRAAEKLGLPDFVARRPKKAIQYTTGVDKVLKQLAKERKMTLAEYLEREFRACIHAEAGAI